MTEVLPLILLIGLIGSHAAAKYLSKRQQIQMRSAFPALKEDPLPKDFISFNLFPSSNAKVRFNYINSNKNDRTDKGKNYKYYLNFVFNNPSSRSPKKKSSTTSSNRKCNN